MTSYSEPVQIARDYYNSTDADTFYFSIWGGEDIHIGLYQSPTEPIFDASRRTVERMAGKLGTLGSQTKVLDLGGGYGGAMRYLAKQFGCKATVLNLSEVENERDREMNKQQNVGHLIDVVDGNFADVPAQDASFDAAWSQDAILHADDRKKVVSEVARVLKPGGVFVFTDPMQTEDAPADALQPIYDRIHLESLASPEFYKQAAAEAGLEFVEFEKHADMVAEHYGRVLKELESREQEVRDAGVSQTYIDNMKKGLQHWVNGAHSGYLTWGIFTFRKA